MKMHRNIVHCSWQTHTRTQLTYYLISYAKNWMFMPENIYKLTK